MWEPNQQLNVFNALKKINEIMKNSGCRYKEVFKTMLGNNNYKININQDKLVDHFKKM